MSDRLAMVERHLNGTFYCTSLVRLAVERARTRFGGLTSVLESPAAADPRWMARTKKDIGADGAFIGTMSVWMAEWDIQLVGVAVDTGRACPSARPASDLSRGICRVGI